MFINRDLAPVAVAAIAHAQFQTIHPFADGNGRAGRALVYAVLRRRREIANYLPPISLIMASEPNGYIDGLTVYRQGAVSTWVEQFADATGRACAAAEQLADAIAQWQRTGSRRSGSLAAMQPSDNSSACYRSNR